MVKAHPWSDMLANFTGKVDPVVHWLVPYLPGTVWGELQGPWPHLPKGHEMWPLKKGDCDLLQQKGQNSNKNKKKDRQKEIHQNQTKLIFLGKKQVVILLDAVLHQSESVHQKFALTSRVRNHSWPKCSTNFKQGTLFTGTGRTRGHTENRRRSGLPGQENRAGQVQAKCRNPNSPKHTGNASTGRLA